MHSPGAIEQLCCVLEKSNTSRKRGKSMKKIIMTLSALAGLFRVVPAKTCADCLQKDFSSLQSVLTQILIEQVKHTRLLERLIEGGR
jgi:hypothetical protein